MDAPQIQVAEAPPVPNAGAATAAAPYRPSTAAAVDLCRRAGRFDWAYLGAMVAADAGTVVLDSQLFQSSGQAGVRLIGPGLVGLSWGWTVGGTYLTLPQCSTDFGGSRPVEGDARSVLPLTLSFSVLSAVTAPVLVGVETGEGSGTLAWSPTERAMRLVVAGAAGLVGSLLPYALPPRTWRALRKLEHLRPSATAHSASLSYALRF